MSRLTHDERMGEGTFDGHHEIFVEGPVSLFSKQNSSIIKSKHRERNHAKGSPGAWSRCRFSLTTLSIFFLNSACRIHNVFVDSKQFADSAQ